MDILVQAFFKEFQNWLSLPSRTASFNSVSRINVDSGNNEDKGTIQIVNNAPALPGKEVKMGEEARVGNWVISVLIALDTPGVTQEALEKLLDEFVAQASNRFDPGYVTGGISEESVSHEEYLKEIESLPEVHDGET